MRTPQEQGAQTVSFRPQGRLRAAAGAEQCALQLVEDLKCAWRRGEPCSAEEMLARQPHLYDFPEAAIKLVYEEYCLRQEAGQDVGLEELAARFPQWRSRLAFVVDCHRLIQHDPPDSLFPAVGEQLGDFRLVALLGRGVHGRVFLATQSTLADRPVVLKVSPSDGQEHLSLARLQHTHIVPLYSAQHFPERKLCALCLPYHGGATLAWIMEALRDTPARERSGRHLVDAIDRVQTTAPVAVTAQTPARNFLGTAG